MSRAVGRSGYGPRGDSCLWCREHGAPDNPAGDPDRLCRGHQAEFYGLTIAELDRCEAEQDAEWLDTLN